MTPSWYDVLGVDEDATPKEIRAAWQESIAGLSPGDRRFKQRNRAAEVLLDPERRAAHDAELAAAEADEVEDDESSDDVAATTVAAPEVTLAKAPERAEPAEPQELEEPTESEDRAEDEPEPEAATTVPGRGPVRSAAVLAVLAVVLVVATVLALVLGDTEEPDPRLPDSREVAAARKAAEAAVVPILSYDYRALDDSADAATSFMTPSYAETYRQNFEAVVADNAERQKAIVTTQVVDVNGHTAAGISEIGLDDDGNAIVEVLVFVNQPIRNRSRDDVSRNQVTLRMVDVDDEWLVDCLIIDTSKPSC